MKEFKFFYKRQGSASTLALWVVGIIGLTILILVDEEFYKYLLYMTIAILYAITVWESIKKGKMNIKEITINNDNLRFYFFNNNKPSLTVSKNEVIMGVEDKFIQFTDAMSGELIGKAYKNQLKESGSWAELLNCLDRGKT